LNPNKVNIFITSNCKFITDYYYYCGGGGGGSGCYLLWEELSTLLWILSTLNLRDMAWKFCIIAVFVIDD
jgi:hypothetical protein